MKLYFENSWGERRLVGEPSTRREAMKMVHQFCEERDFTIHYVRNWIEEDYLAYDIGSHSEFFYLSNDDGTPMTLEG